MPIPKFETHGAALPLDEQRQLLSARLRFARTQLDLTQAEFAAQCGISVPTYKRFELGTCDSLGVLLKIVAMFNRTYALDLLFPGEAANLPQPRTLLGAYDRLQKSRKTTP